MFFQPKQVKDKSYLPIYYSDNFFKIQLKLCSLVLGKKSPSFDSSSYYIPPLSRKHVHFNRDTDESLNSSEYGYQTGGLNHRHNWHY